MKTYKNIVLILMIFSFTISCKNADEIRKRAETEKPVAVAQVVKAIKPNHLGTIKKVTITNFEQVLKIATLLDVRTLEEFTEGHLKGAININFKKRTFPNYIHAISKNKPVAIYCRSGNRSGKAALIMQSFGFKEIYELNGGIKAWNSAKKEVRKTDNNANKKLQEILKKGNLIGKTIVGKNHQIDVTEFEKLVKSGNLTLVDVRKANEYASGFIEGAINVDWKNKHFAENVLKTITNNKPIAIYCRSGNRATRAMYAMAALGFTEIYNLKDGLKSWNTAKMPLKTLEVKGDIRHLDVANFNNAIKGNVGTLIDVRTPKEYKDFHISGAIMIDYKNDNFKSEFEKLDKKTPVLIYCRSGGRSGRAMKILEEMGFKVYNLDHGIKDWKKNKMPVVGKNLHGSHSGEEGC